VELTLLSFNGKVKSVFLFLSLHGIEDIATRVSEQSTVYIFRVEDIYVLKLEYKTAKYPEIMVPPAGLNCTTIRKL
jgi:hypothetical protein